MQYERAILVSGEPADVFAYLADFEHTAEWDPGISAAHRLTSPPTALGSRFDVTATFRGNAQQFEYVVTSFEDGRRVALRGEGSKAISDDEIAVEAAPGGARVTYRADIRLKGVLRLVEPFVGRALRKSADDAMDGLQAKLGPPKGV